MFPHVFQAADTAILVICFIMAAVIVGLNALVLFTLMKRKDNNRLHFFIKHMAVAGVCIMKEYKLL